MAPHYDYRCSACGWEFEEFQKEMLAPAKDLTKCPECNTRAKRKIGSGAAVIFYGPGFYTTDHRTMKDAQPSSVRKRKRAKDKIKFPVTDRRGGKKK